MVHKDTPPRVRLYPHDPTSFLPLLGAHLPHSITTYSTIKTNPWPQLVGIPSDLSLPKAYGISNDAIAGDDHNGTEAQDVPDSLIYGAVWATFPASQMSNPPDIWVMFIHLPKPQTNQTRLYCSLDRELLVAPDPPTTSNSTTTRVQKGTSRWRAGQELMLGVVKTVVETFPSGEKYIPLNALWVDGVVDWLKDNEMATMVHDAYDVWLAPEGGGSETEGGAGSAVGGGVVDKKGLEVGGCRRDDCDVIQSSRDIKEGISYYIARMAHTSVIRRSDTGQPVAWILTHAAGDLGALYTIPEYRRRGLAKWVVEERLKAGKTAVGGVEGGEADDKLRGHVWVSWENVGSRRLWESMGWVRGWSARWVCIK